MVVINMKIMGSQFQQVTKTYQNNKIQRTGSTEPVKGDKVNLSREAKEIARINEILTQTPEVRVEKVNELKAAIQQGTYEVKGDKIAEKMLQSHLFDKVVQ